MTVSHQQRSTIRCSPFRDDRVRTGPIHIAGGQRECLCRRTVIGRIQVCSVNKWSAAGFAAFVPRVCSERRRTRMILRNQWPTPDSGGGRRHPVFRTEISVDAFRDEPGVSAGFTVALDDGRTDSSGLLIFSGPAFPGLPSRDRLVGRLRPA
ncbi:hypothetical protein AORI_6662 [Amycolatopsis keratiniphila]|uniref:Uncharacterized protein n=1 Tax=Amycolatopsis keratiniphila TaxID=129921 RepID=R4T320_9PSEU|nr:hypothetical protein AORI_6662 [Amycolatopsis keratiniphila]